MCMDITEIRNRIDKGEKPAALSKEAWQRKLDLIREHNFHSIIELGEYIDEDDDIDEDYCALCVNYYNRDLEIECQDCTLYKMHEGCGEQGTAYDVVTEIYGCDELVLATEHMISVLDKAVELEKSN